MSRGGFWRTKVIVKNRSCRWSIDGGMGLTFVREKKMKNNDVVYNLALKFIYSICKLQFARRRKEPSFISIRTEKDLIEITPGHLNLHTHTQRHYASSLLM
jgi:hypothetical protein